MLQKALLTALAATTIALAGAGAAQATPVTFFGEDLSNGSPLTAHPNADKARNTFFSNLTNVGTETFESFAAGTPAPIVVDFGTAGMATLTGTGTITSGPTATNQYPISGTKFFDTTGTFLLKFSTPVAAFGFYGTDIGDVSASLVLTLTGSNGTTTLPVPNKVDPTLADGSALYFGFYDTANTYSSISFVGAGTDIFGFDDFSIGNRTQVAPNPVPEPASMALLAAAAATAALVRRRRA